MPMKRLITKELRDKVNSQGIPLTTAQWFTINGYIGMEKYMILEMLLCVKPEVIYDLMEEMQKQIKKDK